jgi:hypothetical protein
MSDEIRDLILNDLSFVAPVWRGGSAQIARLRQREWATIASHTFLDAYAITTDSMSSGLEFWAMRRRGSPQPADERMPDFGLLDDPRRPPAASGVVKNLPRHSATAGESCSICLDDYEKETTVTTLPCNHNFHPKCIGSWFVHDNRCPVCRLELVAGGKRSRSIILRATQFESHIRRENHRRLRQECRHGLKGPSIKALDWKKCDVCCRWSTTTDAPDQRVRRAAHARGAHLFADCGWCRKSWAQGEENRQSRLHSTYKQMYAQARADDGLRHWTTMVIEEDEELAAAIALSLA